MNGDEQDHKQDVRRRLAIGLAALAVLAILAGIIGAIAHVTMRETEAATIPQQAAMGLTRQQRDELDELRMLQVMVEADPKEKAIRTALKERRIGVAILNQNLAWTILQSATPNLDWCARLLEDQVLLQVPERKAEFTDTLDLFRRRMNE